MGWYDSSKPPSPRQVRIFVDLFKPPYEAKKILKSYSKQLPKAFNLFFRFYLSIFLVGAIIVLFVFGFAYAPILIVIAGILVYLKRKQKKSKLKSTKI